MSIFTFVLGIAIGCYFRDKIVAGIARIRGK